MCRKGSKSYVHRGQMDDPSSKWLKFQESKAVSFARLLARPSPYRTWCLCLGLVTTPAAWP